MPFHMTWSFAQRRPHTPEQQLGRLCRDVNPIIWITLTRLDHMPYVFEVLVIEHLSIWIMLSHPNLQVQSPVDTNIRFDVVLIYMKLTTTLWQFNIATENHNYSGASIIELNTLPYQIVKKIPEVDHTNPLITHVNGTLKFITHPPKNLNCCILLIH